MSRRGWAIVLGGLLAVGAAGAGGYWAMRLLAAPEVPPVAADPAAGLRVQERLAQLLLREGGLSRRREPLVVTAPELNAFLARHVGLRRAGISAVVVTFEADRVVVHGRTTLDRVIPEIAPPWLARLAPAGLLDVPVWVVVRGRLETAGRQGRFVVDQAAVGRQPVSPALVPRLVPPELLAGWRLPRVVERVEIQPGRLIVHTRP